MLPVEQLRADCLDLGDAMEPGSVGLVALYALCSCYASVLDEYIARSPPKRGLCQRCGER